MFGEGMGGRQGGAAGQFPLEQWFYEMPLCTRLWTTATIITSILVQCHIITPFQLFYSFRAVFVKNQVRHQSPDSASWDVTDAFQLRSIGDWLPPFCISALCLSTSSSTSSSFSGIHACWRRAAAARPHNFLGCSSTLPRSSSASRLFYRYPSWALH